MLTELKLLDLHHCHSVAEIVSQLSLCSFGARMLGEVSATLTQWMTTQKNILILYDGELSSPLGKTLQAMVKRRWVQKILDSREYFEQGKRLSSEHYLLVIGTFVEKYQTAIQSFPQATIFINTFGLHCSPHLQDGYYPNVIFADPHYIVPLLFSVLEERIQGQKTTVSQFIETLKKTKGLGAEVAQGAEVLKNMVQDPDCTVFLTLSGAMTVAKMGLIICDLIDQELVQGICSTGALMAHGLVESVGLKHFKYNPNINDTELAENRLNRITDTLEPESNLDHVEGILGQILDQNPEQKVLSPRLFHQMIGDYLEQNHAEHRAILKSAFLKQVPVFVPAFHDSEIANDVYVHNCDRKRKGKEPIFFNLELDSEFLISMVNQAQKIGIFTVGGGVPRNFIQNVAPLMEIMTERGLVDFPERQFTYGCRICPDPMYYGHLSGCTYSEGVSWRKMNEQGQFSEIHSDATLVLPFLVKYILEN